MPTVTFVSTAFKALSMGRREALGVPAPFVWVPHPMMNLTPAAIDALAERILPDVVMLLTTQPSPR